MSDSKFTDDEAQAILRRAVHTRDADESISREELIETAREVGLSPEELEAAIRAETESRENAEVRALWQARRRKALARSAPMWVLVAGLLALGHVFLGLALWSVWMAAASVGIVAFRTAQLALGPSAQELEYLRIERRRLLKSATDGQRQLAATSTTSPASSSTSTTASTSTVREPDAETREFMERLAEERRTRAPLKKAHQPVAEPSTKK